MDLSQTTQTFVSDDQSWLGSAHATDTAETVTLDIALFTTLLGSTFTGGFIPSGVVIGKVTATGKYGPYSNAALDGRETARGFLFHAVKAKTGDTNDKVGASLWHGQVIEAKLPTGHGLDAAAKVELKLIDFV
jgi:hypothetical protein